MPETYILPLATPHATLALIGGKGASLARLVNAGLPVPPGFHITTAAYRQFVAENGLQAPILAAVSAANPAQPETLEAASRQIAQLFAQGALPPEIAEAIGRAYAELGEDAPVAVRSSATAEDLPDLSFAGQQETYLNIRGEVALLEAVRHCWASLWTARAIAYRLQNGIDQEAVALAVVVQALIPAEAAGVMFTADPVSGRRDQVVINAAWGLGEAIVGGLVTPDSLTVEKASGRVLSRETADKEVMTVRVETGTVEQPVSEVRRHAPVLDDTQAAELARLGARIEPLYGKPMDIEWALAEGRFAILQARPITALPEAMAEPPKEWKLPDPKGMYMRMSIIEQLPEPLTPLFSTLAGPIIDAVTRQVFSLMAGGPGLPPGLKLFETINGYGYLNGNFGLWNFVKAGVSQAVKMNWIFSQSEPRWRQAHDHYLGVIKTWQKKPVSDYSAAELLEGTCALFGETMALYAVLQTGPIATALGSETILTQLYDRLIKKKGDPEAAVFVMGFESMPVLAEEALYDLAEWARSSPELAAYLTATPAATLAIELESADAPPGLLPEAWGEWRRRFQAHLARYGHFTYDLDFSKAVAADDPAPLLETCRMFCWARLAARMPACRRWPNGGSRLPRRS